MLLAIDLSPADAAGLDATRCLGIATEEGGPTSHTAIIARSLGIPTVVAAHGLAAIPDGTLVLLDGDTGELIIEPSVDQQAAVEPVGDAGRGYGARGELGGGASRLLTPGGAGTVSAFLRHS